MIKALQTVSNANSIDDFLIRDSLNGSSWLINNFSESLFDSNTASACVGPGLEQHTVLNPPKTFILNVFIQGSISVFLNTNKKWINVTLFSLITQKKTTKVKVKRLPMTFLFIHTLIWSESFILQCWKPGCIKWHDNTTCRCSAIFRLSKVKLS